MTEINRYSKFTIFVINTCNLFVFAYRTLYDCFYFFDKLFCTFFVRWFIVLCVSSVILWGRVLVFCFRCSINCLCFLFASDFVFEDVSVATSTTTNTKLIRNTITENFSPFKYSGFRTSFRILHKTISIRNIIPINNDNVHNVANVFITILLFKFIFTIILTRSELKSNADKKIIINSISG